MKDRFNPTTEAILSATESMLHWGLPPELIAKAVEHLKGLQRLRDSERERKAAEIQAEVQRAVAGLDRATLRVGEEHYCGALRERLHRTPTSLFVRCTLANRHPGACVFEEERTPAS